MWNRLCKYTMYNIYAKNMAGQNFGISLIHMATEGKNKWCFMKKSVLRPFGPDFLEYLDNQCHCFSKEIETFWKVVLSCPV